MKKIILVILFAVLASGCSTVVRGSRQDVEIKTNPPGLLARINTQQCFTPCTLQNVSRKSAEEILITHEGIERRYPLDRSFNFWTTIVGNIWNEVWIGLIVDSISGAMFSIEDVDLNFEKSAKVN